MRDLFAIVREIVSGRRMIWELSRNDFRTRYAGSYLGIIWAFIQPVVTVFVYWFVFEKALNAASQSTKAGITVPYVLWLIAGLVPWFYFSEVVNSGTGCLIDYAYLVKKVVFRIEILPVVRIVSGMFVHLFFIAFMLIMYGIYHRLPGVFDLQLLYYSFAMMCMCVGIVYLTSSIAVFFRDIQQIINILLQIGVWFTPILWNVDALAMPDWFKVLVKLNPMYYIVSGYRESVIDQRGFWAHPELTLYFWGVTVILFLLGTHVFRRLQPHFADVL